MKLSSEIRLHKLETFHGNRERRYFAIGALTKEEEQAEIDELIRSGDASPEDVFIITGVPRHKDFGKWTISDRDP